MTLKAEISIEPFHPTDLTNVVRLHTVCFTLEENFSLCLGEEFLAATYEFFLNDANSFGFLAKHNSEVVGVLVGRLDYYTRALNRYRMTAGLLALARRPLLAFNKRVVGWGLKVGYRFAFHKAQTKNLELAPSHADGGTATLASLCVHPDYRPYKVSDQLLSVVEDLCRRKGMRYLRAGVSRKNVASRFAYRRRGYLEDKILSTEDELLYYLSLTKSPASANRS